MPSLYGLAAVNPTDSKVVPFAHNLDYKTATEAKTDLDAAAKPPLRVVLYTHALTHTTHEPADCPGCKAAIEETVKIAKEDRDARRAATPTAPSGASGPSLLER